MWVSIYDPFVSNLGIDECLNQSDYTWIIHHTLPFCLYGCIPPLCNKFAPSSIHCRYSADMVLMNVLKRSYAYDVALSTTLFAAASQYSRISWIYICSSSGYSTYRDSYLPSIDNTLSITPRNRTITLKVPRLSSSANSQCCTTSMPCGHLEFSNLHA